MSTQLQASPGLTSRADPETILNDLWSHPGLCPWCFAQKRRYYTEYEESVAEYLATSNCKESTYEARGHTVDGDGNLLVDSTATSDPDPNTFFDVVPPTVIDHNHDKDTGKLHDPDPERKQARAQSLCECGCIDYDPEDNRPKEILHKAVRNIATHLTDAEDIDVSQSAMEAYVESGLNNRMGGLDEKLLRGAIRFGLKKA